MPPSIGTRQLLTETIPVAVILCFWAALSAVPHGVFASGFRYAGIIMALLYVIVRGMQLAGAKSFPAHPTDLGELLRENAKVALIAGVWLFAAFLIASTRPLWKILSMMGTPYPRGMDALASGFLGITDLLVFVLTGTGVATVTLYAVAVGISRSHDLPPGSVSGRNSDL